MSSSAKHGRNAEVNERDLKILRGLFEARIMTARHVAAIYFEGRYEAARKRLQKLKAAEFVGERPRRTYDPAILFLTRKAFELLSRSGAVGDLPVMTWASLERRVRVSPLTLRHELEVQDVRASMHEHLAQCKGLSIRNFSTWQLLFEFQARDGVGKAVAVKPDGFIRIDCQSQSGPSSHRFYLELDRSTEPLDILVRRAQCYHDYYHRGGLAIRHGRPPEEFAQFPFRVLIVFKTAERRNNLAQRLLLSRPPILTQIWLTTFPEILRDPFGPIWLRPVDYRNSLGNFPLLTIDGQYRRRPAREQFLELRLTKQNLF